MFLLRLALVVLAAVTVQSDYRRVCYYTNWAQYRQGAGKFFPENVDPQLCTHLIYSFAKLEGNKLFAYEWNDESTPWMKGMYERFGNLKQSNPNLKTLIAVGGWNMASAPFTRMVASASSRQEFATSTVKFLRDHNFDGLDIDWEYPANRGSPPEDKQRFAQLIETVRREFDAEASTSGKDRLLLSAAVPAGKDNIDSGYDVPPMVKYLDMINLMTYDLHGSWEDHTGHNSPLFKHAGEAGNNTYLNLDWAANYWVNRGVPPSMINVGMGLYGRSFRLKDANSHDLGSPVSGAGERGQYTGENGFMAYYEICEMLKTGGSKYYIADQKVPYAVKGTNWVGYDDRDSLKIKVQYVKQHNFGGAMVWALDLDDFSGSCGEGKYPLLNAIKDELLSSTGPNVQPETTQPHQHTTAAVHTNPTQAPQNQVTTAVPGPTHKPQHIGLTTNYNCAGKTSGFYPNPHACDEYFICAGNLAFEVRCASGLQFNTHTTYCDWPYNVHCSIKSTHAPVVTTHQPTHGPTTQHHVTHAPTTHHVTHAPTTHHVTHAPTTHHVTQAPVQTQQPTQAPANSGTHKFCDGKADGHFRDPTDCNKFYQCVNGLTFHESCGAGTAFNEQNLICDFPINVPGCAGK